MQEGWNLDYGNKVGGGPLRGRALTQISFSHGLETGSATFKIVNAPHMTPYMVSIAPQFLLMASGLRDPQNAFSLGNMVTLSHC